MNCSGEPAPQDPPADANFSKKTTADSLQDPEPVEAQEQETTNTDASNYIDLTNTVDYQIKGKATYAYVNG